MAIDWTRQKIYPRRGRFPSGPKLSKDAHFRCYEQVHQCAETERSIPTRLHLTKQKAAIRHHDTIKQWIVSDHEERGGPHRRENSKQVLGQPCHGTPSNRADGCFASSKLLIFTRKDPVIGQSDLDRRDDYMPSLSNACGVRLLTSLCGSGTSAVRRTLSWYRCDY